MLGQYVTFDECPEELKPAMRGLDAIARRMRDVSEEDDAYAMELLAQGKDEELERHVTRMERLKLMLERGVGVEEAQSPVGANGNDDVHRGRSSPSGTTIQLANKVNGLALGLMSIPAFRERQGDVFRILAGVR